MKTWKRRWFILTDNCLYYFEYTTVSRQIDVFLCVRMDSIWVLLLFTRMHTNICLFADHQQKKTYLIEWIEELFSIVANLLFLPRVKAAVGNFN